MNAFQSRYIAYAKHHGKTPEQMEATGENNHPFIAWITEKWRKYDRLHPEHYGVHNDEAHAQFDDMLNRGMI